MKYIYIVIIVVLFTSCSNNKVNKVSESEDSSTYVVGSSKIFYQSLKTPLFKSDSGEYLTLKSGKIFRIEHNATGQIAKLYNSKTSPTNLQGWDESDNDFAYFEATSHVFDNKELIVLAHRKFDTDTAAIDIYDPEKEEKVFSDTTDGRVYIFNKFMVFPYGSQGQANGFAFNNAKFQEEGYFEYFDWFDFAKFPNKYNTFKIEN